MGIIVVISLCTPEDAAALVSHIVLINFIIKRWTEEN